MTFSQVIYHFFKISDPLKGRLLVLFVLINSLVVKYLHDKHHLTLNG